VTAPTAASGPVQSYDRIARAAHWLVAALVVIVVSLGWAIPGAPRETPSRDLLLLLHRSVGLSVLALMLFRVGWRFCHPAPPLPSALARAERDLARMTHFVLYVLLIAMPLAGYVNAAAAGHGIPLFGLAVIPPLLPENGRVSQAAITVHLVGQYFLYFLVALHVAGALSHGVVRRDGVLERMLPAAARRTSQVRQRRD
jgi:cytochrome b561